MLPVTLQVMALTGCPGTLVSRGLNLDLILDILLVLHAFSWYLSRFRVGQSSFGYPTRADCDLQVLVVSYMLLGANMDSPIAESVECCTCN